jgi:hypothetical protein
LFGRAAKILELAHKSNSKSTVIVLLRRENFGNSEQKQLKLTRSENFWNL